jgi:hypothetical protein
LIIDRHIDQDKQGFQFFHRKHNKSFKIVKIANNFITFSNFDNLLSQTLTKLSQIFPSFTFNFKQVSVPFLTNFAQRLNYWGCYTPPPPTHSAYSDVPASKLNGYAVDFLLHIPFNSDGYAVDCLRQNISRDIFMYNHPMLNGITIQC